MTLATGALAPAYNPGSWSTFFVLTGTVAATLTGLFFVAFSLRVRDLQLSVVIRTRAAYLLALLVVIVVYSAFVLMPGQSRAAVAAEILIVSVVGVAYLCGWCLPRLVRLAVFSVDLVIRWIAGVTGLLLGVGEEVDARAGESVSEVREGAPVLGLGLRGRLSVRHGCSLQLVFSACGLDGARQLVPATV